MRGWFLAVLAVVPGLRGQGLETMQGAVGAVFPAGVTGTRLETGWSLAFGGVYWFSDWVGIHTELGVHRFGLSDAFRNEIGPARDGMATLLMVPVNGVFRLHGPGQAGLYLLAGAGICNRQLELSEPSTTPLARDEPWAGVRAGWIPQENLSTTRVGLDVGLGWEQPRGRGHFFVEVRYHRVFTRGLPTEFVPVLLGTRF